jgi:hypothetical protein
MLLESKILSFLGVKDKQSFRKGQDIVSGLSELLGFVPGITVEAAVQGFWF